MKVLFFNIISMCCFTLASANPCVIPDTFHNKTFIQHEDLLIGFATDRIIYAQDGIIEFILQVTNTGSDTVYVSWPYSPHDAYAILPPLCNSVDYGDCRDRALLVKPNSVLWYGSFLYLLPGECTSYRFTWQIPPPGIRDQPVRPIKAYYTVLGGLFQMGDWISEWGDFVIPPGGAKLNIVITDRVPSGINTWGQIKNLFSQ